ncbi:MAG TPA: molybdate ABC transporter substrate-binding protein [Cyanobacteria bacterium UBA8530]|nr:molybdate ABC transporter substrate-binding protein [Cyanobacteria bacterium UBA8530]
MSQETSYHNYAQLFKVLADETRLGIMRLLIKQDRTVGELANQLGLPIARISHHLAILRAESLIRDRRVGKQIICSIPTLASFLASGQGTRSSALYDLLALLDEERDLPKPGDDLVIFAAASLSRAFEEIGLAFEEKTGIRVRFRFGASHALAAELASGQFADLFAASSLEAIKPLEKRGLFHFERFFARSRLALWQQEAPIHQLAALLQVRWVVIANPVSAPCGALATALLKREGLWDAIQTRLILGRDAVQALDVADQNGGVALTSLAVIPSNHGFSLLLPAAPIEYALASTCISSRHPYAEAFLGFLEKNQNTLKRHGLSNQT